MADQKSTVTLSGDSAELVEAVDSASSAVETLTEETTALNEATEAAPKSVESATRAYTEFSAKSKELGRDVRNSTRAFDDLSGVVSQVSPQAGAALRGITTLSRGVRGATAALGPLTIAIAAVSVAVKAGEVVWARHQATLESAKKAGEDYEASIESLRASIDEQSASLNAANSAAISYVSTLEGASDVVRDFNEQQRRIEAGREISEGREQLKEYDRQAREAGQGIAELADAQAALRDRNTGLAESTRVLNALSGENAEIVRKGIESGKSATEALSELQTLRTQEIQKLGEQRAGLAQMLDLYDRASEAHEEASRSAAAQSESIDRVTKSAAEVSAEIRAMTDAILKAAIATGDFDRVGNIMAQGGEAAQYLAQALVDVADGALIGAGATVDMIADIRALNDEMQTGAEAARELQAIYAEGLAAQAAEDQEKAHLEERIAAQQEWAEVVTLSFDAAQERQQMLLESGMEGLASMREITDAEMSAITQHFDEIRAQQQEAAQQVQSLQDQMVSGFETAVVGGLSGAISSLSSAFTEAMISGENMAEALGKAALQAVGMIAVQFGTLMLTTALGMAFLPGFQGNAVGLGIGGGALIALGASLGVAANAIGAGGGTQPQAADTSTPSSDFSLDRGDRTVIAGELSTTSIDPAYDARREGDARRNADRYGIDKRRAYA